MNRKGNLFVPVALAIVMSVVVAAVFVPMAMWTGRNLDFWLTHFKGHAVHVPFWLDYVISVFGNGVVFMANLAGEVGRYCIEL